MSWECVHCKEAHEDAFDSCWKCGRERIGEPVFNPFTAPLVPDRSIKPNLPCATTPHLPGREILETLGLVFGEAALDTDLFEDFASGFRAPENRSETYEGTLRDTRLTALQQMEQEAGAIGADAVVGVSLEYESVGRFLMVSVSGTAVMLRPAT